MEVGTRTHGAETVSCRWSIGRRLLRTGRSRRSGGLSGGLSAQTAVTGLLLRLALLETLAMQPVMVVG